MKLPTVNQGASTTVSRLCILVAGMHRSGTSATTRVVNLLGADIAQDLSPPLANNNERGFWESRAIIEIHDELLSALGSAWDDPFQLPERWIETSFALIAKQQLAARLAEDFGSSKSFVIKDPRIARLLPLWLELLDELGIESLVVIPFRHPLEVADSLWKRQMFPREKSLLLYVWSYLETEAASRGRRRLFIDYHSLLADWRSVAGRLEAAAGSWLTVTAGSENAIDDFLTRDLQHNKYDPEQLAGHPEVASLVTEIFDCMREAERTGKEDRLSPSFDRLHGSVMESAKLFRGFVPADRSESSRLADELAVARDRVTELEGKYTEQTAELTRSWDWIKELGKVHSAQIDELILTRNRVLELEKAYRELESELALSSSRIAELEQVCAERMSALVGSRSRMTELENLSAAGQSDLILSHSRIAELENLLAAGQGELVLSRSRIALLENARDVQAAEVSALHSSVSWRVTRPLRKLNDMYRWLLRIVERTGQ
jgi:hypothetical protein